MTPKNDLVFCADRSIRYHDRRRAFYEFADGSSSWLSLISGSAAVAALINTAFPDGWAIVFGCITAVTGLFMVVMRPASMAALHAQLKQRFVGLRIKLAKVGEDVSAEQLTLFEVERLDIEREEPPIYRALDLVCHNEVALAMGKNDPAHLYRLPPYKRLTANLWRWDTNEVPSVAEYEAQQQKRLGGT